MSKLNKPSWANWKAMDVSGCWYWYADLPSPRSVGWGSGGSGTYGLIHPHPTTTKRWTNTLTYVGKEEEMKDMKLKDLKAGMRVETRCGDQGLVVDNGVGGLYLLLALECSAGVSLKSHYRSDLTRHTAKKSDDIMKVWESNRYGAETTCDLSFKFTTYPDWLRKEVKELTVGEIEEILGYGVKVVERSNANS